MMDIHFTRSRDGWAAARWLALLAVALACRAAEAEPAPAPAGAIVPRTLSYADYRAKVRGCWLGKAAGGTLGAAVDGRAERFNFTYYSAAPTQMQPTLGTDMQLASLRILRRRGLPIERHLLAECRLLHVRDWADEVGIADRGLRQLLWPPLCGAFDNPLSANIGGMGRSELWACLSPGIPRLAAALAREDVCCDHEREGMYAAIFMTTLQSAAFVESDRERLLDMAAAAVPPESRVAQAVNDTRHWLRQSSDWRLVVEQILTEHGRADTTDSPQNLAFVVLGWLVGGDDFGRAICTTVNCGKSTAINGGALGALLGILNPQGIEERWVRPLGKGPVLSPRVVGMQPPETWDELADQTAVLGADVLAYYGAHHKLTDMPDLAAQRASMDPPRMADGIELLLRSDAAASEALVATEPLVIRIGYPPQVAFLPGQTADLAVRIGNPTEIPLPVDLTVRAPDGWKLAVDNFHFALRPGAEQSFKLTLTAPPVAATRVAPNLLSFSFSIHGIRFRVIAGLHQTWPWFRWPVPDMPRLPPPIPDDAVTVENTGHIQPLPAGPTVLATDVYLPCLDTYRVVAQASRMLRVWIDGEPALTSQGTYIIPSINRAAGSATDIRLGAGWHRVVVMVGEGKEDHLFFGIADPGSGRWNVDLQYRQPAR